MAEHLYLICNAAVLQAWLLLIFAPRWRWTATLVGPVLIPLLMGATYTALVVANVGSIDSTFSQLSDVARLFDNPYLLLAGWAHYLAFDLFVGSWQVRDAARLKIPHLLVVPCLLLTFLLGPVGFVCYFILRISLRKEWAIR